MRSILYFLARILGDMQAVRRGRIGRRIARRILGKGAGRVLRRVVPAVILCAILATSAPAFAKPVNSHQFSLLRVGWTAIVVQGRLGKPDRHVGYVKHIRRKGSVLVEIWEYEGNRRTMPVRLMFHDGVLVQKNKVR